jgi:hypothetical protein
MVQYFLFTNKIVIIHYKKMVVRISYTAPSAPVNVSVTSIPRKPHQLLVTWTRPLYPNGIIREFMINYRKIGEDRYLRKVLVISGTSERVILEDLEPFTKYLVSVRT